MPSSESNNMTPKKMLDKYTQLYTLPNLNTVGVAFYLFVPPQVQNKTMDLSVLVQVNSTNIVNSIWNNRKHMLINHSLEDVDILTKQVAKHFSEFITIAKKLITFYPNTLELHVDGTKDQGMVYEVVVRVETIKKLFTHETFAIFELVLFDFDNQGRSAKGFRKIRQNKETHKTVMKQVNKLVRGTNGPVAA